LIDLHISVKGIIQHSIVINNIINKLILRYLKVKKSHNIISIIIVNHNYINYIDQCIESVLKNNSKIIKEIIVIDDASSDGSFKWIKKKYNKISKIRLFKVKFKNLSKTLNYAINKANGEWIFKIDADDYINQNLVNTFFRYMKNYDFIFGDIIIFDKNKKSRLRQIVKKNFLKYFKHPVGSGNLYRKKLWEKINGYNEDFYYKDDAYFWSKINQFKNLRVKYVKKSCYYYRQHHKSMSKNVLKKYLTLLKIILLPKNV
jgi:glycosyltransferase involved in cell wall biosynthesis